MNTVANSLGYLTTDQVAELLHVSATTLATWRCIGRGPAYTKAGARSVLYAQSDVLQWLEEGKHAPKEQLRPVGVPLPTGRSESSAGHRFGGYQTKAQKGNRPEKGE